MHKRFSFRQKILVSALDKVIYTRLKTLLQSIFYLVEKQFEFNIDKQVVIADLVWFCQ